jgi:hypothetical protein
MQAARLRIKAKEDASNPYTMTPPMGSIPPFSSVQLSITFSPKAKVPPSSFSTQPLQTQAYNRSFDCILLLDFGRQLPAVRLPVTGKGAPPALQLVPSVLHFGDLPTYAYADQLVQVCWELEWVANSP